METIPTEGKPTGNVIQHAFNLYPWSETKHEVMIRVLRDHDRDMLLVEHEYDHAQLVSEFEILNDDTVRSRKPTTQHQDFVLKAVAASGFDNIEDPDWP